MTIVLAGQLFPIFVNPSSPFWGYLYALFNNDCTGLNAQDGLR